MSVTYISCGMADPPEGTDEAWARQWRHTMAAVSEGLCPVHATTLEPRPGPAGRIAGHCALCRRYWGANLESQVAGWWLDYDPRTGWPVTAVPRFMAAAGEAG